MKNKKIYLATFPFIILVCIIIFINIIIWNKDIKAYGDTNNIVNATTSVAIKAVFENLPNGYNKPNIEVRLTCNDINKGDIVLLDESNNYSYEWKNLEKYYFDNTMHLTPSDINNTSLNIIHTSSSPDIDAIDNYLVKNYYHVDVISEVSNDFHLSYEEDGENKYILRFIYLGRNENGINVEKSLNYNVSHPKEGDNIFSEITVKNISNHEVNGIWIRVYMPKYTSYISSDEGKYGFVNDKEHVTIFLPKLEEGAIKVIHVNMKVDYCIAGDLDWDCYAQIIGGNEAPYFNTPNNPQIKF